MKTFSQSPKTKMKLLAFFLENPTEEVYESMVRKKTRVSAGAVNKCLKEMASDGILLLSKKGAMNFYKLNRENSIVKQLKITYNLSLPVVKQLKNIAKELGIKIYLYGSVARGEDTEHSDWDLLAIGNVGADVLQRKLRPVRSKFNKQIRVALFTNIEWAKMKSKDPAFYERVEKDKIELV